MDVAEFIRTYGKPYDPATDDYDVPPFQKSFDNASKASKIYNMHLYSRVSRISSRSGSLFATACPLIQGRAIPPGIGQSPPG